MITQAPSVTLSPPQGQSAALAQTLGDFPVQITQCRPRGKYPGAARISITSDPPLGPLNRQQPKPHSLFAHPALTPRPASDALGA